MLSIGKNQHEQDGHRIWSSGIGLFLSVNILNPFGLRAQPRTNSAADSWAGDSGKAKRMTALPLCQQTPPSILHIILNVLCSDRGATSACQLLSTIPFQRGEDAAPSTVPGTKRAPAAAKSLQSACFHTSSSKTAFQGERWDDKSMHTYKHNPHRATIKVGLFSFGHLCTTFVTLVGACSSILTASIDPNKFPKDCGTEATDEHDRYGQTGTELPCKQLN